MLGSNLAWFIALALKWIAPMSEEVEPARPLELTSEFARRIAGLRYEDLPPAALHWAKVGLLDTIGVTLAGSREESVRIAADALELHDGPALMFGSARRIGTLDAALINGTASHALDFDDSSNTLGGHPSSPVLSALIPLADELRCSGKELLLAYIAGFEVETKLARAVNLHHYTKGWHPTATLGVFGAAAACCKLMRLAPERIAHALALCGSFSSGIKANFGTMTKPLHVGHCARNGLYAARLAARGFTANAREMFEHRQGFLEVFNGAGTYDTARALSSWAAPLDIIEPGIGIKLYPCCGGTHPAIDAMLELVREHRLHASDVASIEGRVHARRLVHTNRPEPASALDAKFSLQYVLARALMDGRIAADHFESASWTDPAVRELMQRVTVLPYDARHFNEENHFGGHVTVTLNNGNVLVAQVDQPFGRSSSSPLPQHLLLEKFRQCATSLLPESVVPLLAGKIEAFEAIDDVHEITELIASQTNLERTAN